MHMRQHIDVTQTSVDFHSPLSLSFIVPLINKFRSSTLKINRLAYGIPVGYIDPIILVAKCLHSGIYINNRMYLSAIKNNCLSNSQVIARVQF